MSKYKELATELLPHLKKRNFEAYYCENGEEAANLAISFIDKNDVIAFGGSRTVLEVGIPDKLREGGYNLIERGRSFSPEENERRMRQGLISDTFLMGTNAITKDGILVNIDGTGNRVAAMCYGPKQVIIVVGMNKLCDTLEDAVYRVQNVASPLNAKRFGLTKTGCSKGKCVDCLSDECMCSYIVQTRRCKPKGKIKVILVGEDLGF